MPNNLQQYAYNNTLQQYALPAYGNVITYLPHLPVGKAEEGNNVLMEAKNDCIEGERTTIGSSSTDKHEDQYSSVVTVHHHHAKDAFLLSDYFIPRCTHHFLFTFGMAKDLESSNSIQFSEYHRGTLVRQKELVRNQWQSFFPRYAQLIFWFTIFALCFMPRRSWILTPHPPVFFFKKVLRALKMHQFIFIIADIFQYDEESLSGAMFNRHVRRCVQSADHVLYLSPEIQKRHDLNEEGERTPRVRKRWSLGIGRRFDEEQLMEKAIRLGDSATTAIGYVGVVRSVVGLDHLIDYVERHDRVRLDVVGEGVYTKELVRRCEELNLGSRVVFHGFLSTDDVEALARDWLCGAMLYDPDNELYTRHTEPGKAKLYISLGLPVLMTDVSYIVDEIRQRKAGLVLPSSDPDLIAEGVEEIKRDYPAYVKGTVAMAQAYDYECKYDDDFAFMKQLPART